MERQVRNARLAGEGDAELAILRQRLAIAPQANDVRMRLAEKYESAGFPDVSLEHVRIARGYDPSAQPLLLKEVGLLRQLGLPGQAAEAISRYLASCSRPEPEILSWHGITLDEAGRTQEGEKAHRAALAMSPDDDVLRNNLGYNLFAQDRYTEAAREFEEALRLNRRSETARANLARLLAMRPDAPDATGAVAHWTTALGAAAAHNNLAASYLEQGRYDQAREEISAALRYRPDYWPALKNLELAAELDGRPAQVTTGATRTRWQRFTSAMKRVFGTTEDAPRRSTGPAMSASR
jgi:Flp pilus assembly protein TadD